jgi:hypothetical protein
MRRKRSSGHYVYTPFMRPIIITASDWNPHRAHETLASLVDLSGMTYHVDDANNLHVVLI